MNSIYVKLQEVRVGDWIKLPPTRNGTFKGEVFKIIRIAPIEFERQEKMDEALYRIYGKAGERWEFSTTNWFASGFKHDPKILTKEEAMMELL